MMVAGKGLDFISSNVEAQRALMQLHPCKLMTLVQSTAAAPTATGNSQTGMNGRSGRADLSQPDSAAGSAQQWHNAVTDHASLRRPAPEASAYQDINRAQVTTARMHMYKLSLQLARLAMAHPTSQIHFYVGPPLRSQNLVRRCVLSRAGQASNIDC